MGLASFIWVFSFCQYKEMTPYEVRRLLECLCLPGPACNLISRFAVEHPTAKLIKELEFEDSPTLLYPTCDRVLVFGDSLPRVRKVFNLDAKWGYIVMLDFSDSSYRALTFDKETGEPSNAGSPMGINGHKWHARVRLPSGMWVYMGISGPHQWAYDEYTTRRGRQARRRSRLRRLRNNDVSTPSGAG